MRHIRASRTGTALAATLGLAVSGTLVLGTATALTHTGRPAAPRAADGWSPPPAALTADGRIYEMRRLGDRIYVRGGFRTIGAFSGSGMPLDATTGARVQAPQTDGQVSVVVADGSGGWYVGGDFRHIGDLAAGGLAHLDADGMPDPAFTPRVKGLVDAMAYHDGTLWIGGDFTKVDGTTRQRLAAVSADTGALLPFVSPKSIRVTEIAYAAASGDRPARVYVGTDRVVALDPVTGATDPGFVSPLRGDVRSLLVDGDTVYVGGSGLSALDADTGSADPAFGLPGQDFPSDTPGTVHTLMAAGGRLYAGGDFPTLGGGPAGLVALDPQTGLADPAFDAHLSRFRSRSSDRGVFDLAMVGDTLWASGAFVRAGGGNSGNLVALDPATGARDTGVHPPSYDLQVNAVELSGDRLYVGGHFYMTDAVHSSGFAALDATTLMPVPGFDAARNGYGSMVPGKKSIYLSWTHFDGYDPSAYARKHHQYYWASTDRIRAVDADTGASRKDLELRGVENLTGITTLGNELFVVQRLANNVRFPENRVSVYSQSTGDLKRRFKLPLPGYVTELSTVGDQLVVAGSFRRWRPSGQPAHLAAIQISPRDGRLNQEFDPHTHGPIDDLDASGHRLLVAGLFDRVHTGLTSVDRPGLAAFSRSGSFLSFLNLFDPPKAFANRRVSEVVDLGDAVMVRAYGTYFLDDDTAQRLTGVTDGYTTEVDAAVPDPTGIVYAATLSLPLAGHDYYYLSFVSRAAG